MTNQITAGRRRSRFLTTLLREKYLWFMILPVLVYYGIFMYAPMFGLQIAFKNYRPSIGVWKSAWVGTKHFETFFNSYYFERLLRNTVLINLLDVLLGFPAPILLALLLNEVRHMGYKRVIQTVTYMPHFVSLVVMCGMIVDFFSLSGFVNDIIASMGLNRIGFLDEPQYFRSMFVISGIWQEIGWGSIIYLSALSSIDTQLYEAAEIDGAGRFRKLISVTLPGILSTIIIMLLLRLGRMMNVGAEKVLLLYNPSTYETADVISTFVYRKGLLEANYGYATAVGLFNSVINFVFLVGVNSFSKHTSGVALW